MRLIFIGGALDHITLPLCEAFYELLGKEFGFVATKPFSSSRTDLGYGSLNDQYDFVIKNYEYPMEVQNVINSADVVIYGSAPEALIKKRMKDGKLTFRFTERLYKEPFTWKNRLYRRLSAYLHHGIYQRKQVYVLCAGAYVAYDFSRYNYYKDRFFKWCYFTQVSDKKYEDLLKLKEKNEVVEIVWTARFIPLKHPEVVVHLANYLQEKKVPFHITMLGGGEVLDDMKNLTKIMGVEESITFTGAVTPEEVRACMEKADISLFTSNRQEGWGAVVNEAMGSACAVVASSAAGSPPLLINDDENGLLFDLDDLEHFYSSVYELITNDNRRRKIGLNAYDSVQNLWTPKNAARSFLNLVDSIESGNMKPAEVGPCSIAPVLKDGWYRERRLNGK